MWKKAFAGASALAIIGLALLSAEVIGKESAHRTRAREAAEAKAQPQVAPKTPDAAAPSTAGDAPHFGERVALVIGNAEYADDATPLRHPLKDAGALADELKHRGFDVELGENLTKSGMERAIARFQAKIGPGSTALFYFSGYGVQAGRQSYMVPVNAQIWRHEDVPRDGFNLESLVSEMSVKGASLKLVVIDASRRNPFERRLRGFSTGLAPIAGPDGTLVLYSVAPGKVANDADGDNSLLVGELLKEMRAPGLTIEEIFNHTRMNVARASRGEQVPGVFSSLIEDSYFTQPSSRQSAR